MTLMALTRAKSSVIIFSWTAGVMYSTLFTMPYLLVAHYHSVGTVSIQHKFVINISDKFASLFSLKWMVRAVQTMDLVYEAWEQISP